jgi:thiamine-phosphate pyrophosphorylase
VSNNAGRHENSECHIGARASAKRYEPNALDFDRTFLMQQLPRLMLVTHSGVMSPDFALSLEAALRGGARLIQLRESALQGTSMRSDMIVTARSLCRKFGATLLLNGEEDEARRREADGVHWPSRLIPTVREPSEAPEFLRGASVHSPQEAWRARTAGADYLLFGSVWETESHPGMKGTGLKVLREACALSSLPVFAIGGVTPERIALCREAGAWGVAVMRAAWQAPDVEQTVRELVEAANQPLSIN